MEPASENKFEQLCEATNTAVVTLNNALQELFGFKDELVKYALPPKLLVQFTLLSSRVFRCYSDLCTPMGELVRLAQTSSGAWLEKGAGLAKLRADHISMQRRLNIALRKLELTAAKEERFGRDQTVSNWERLYSRVMLCKSHGRRWKFRIEPFKRKLEDGFNPYVSDDSDDDSEEEEGEEGELQLKGSRPLTSPMEGSDEELQGLASDSDGGLCSELSRSLSSHSAFQKRVRFADNRGAIPGSPAEPDLQAPLPVETCETGTSTADPDYDQYLLLQIYRPKGLLEGQDVCCTVSLGDQFHSSRAFPGKPGSGASLLTHQFFPLALSTDAARVLEGGGGGGEEELLESLSGLPKLSVAVYPRSVGEDMAAHVSLPLRELVCTESPTVIVPPDSTSEEKFVVPWTKLEAEVQGLPTDYTLSSSSSVGQAETEGGSPLGPPVLPLTCHRVKVQRHKKMQSATNTVAIEELLAELGYRLVPDLQSRAVSAIALIDGEEGGGREEAAEGDERREEKEEEEHGGRVSQEQLAALARQHEEETARLKSDYQRKLDSINGALRKLKEDKDTQIKELETALLKALQSKGMRGKPLEDFTGYLEQRRPARAVSHGLPEWGKDLPPNFLDRLELFSDVSARKQMELTEKIKQEVSEACEKQLATQHKLAPGLRTDIDATMEDVSLPALFMPSHSSKPLVFTPRAHGYFHPPGSTNTRVTQPPAVFKLPTLHATHMATMNLFELSQQFSHAGPQWLKEHAHQSPSLTPAPPPSACGHYHGNNRDTPTSPQHHNH